MNVAKNLTSLEVSVFCWHECLTVGCLSDELSIPFISFQTVHAFCIKTRGDVPSTIFKILACLGMRGKVISIMFLPFFWLVQNSAGFCVQVFKACTQWNVSVCVTNSLLIKHAVEQVYQIAWSAKCVLEFKIWTDGMETLFAVEWMWRWDAERERRSCLSAAQLHSNYFLTICSVSTYFSSFNHFGVALENSPAVRHSERWEEVLNKI